MNGVTLSEQLLYLMCKKKPDSLEHGLANHIMEKAIINWQRFIFSELFYELDIETIFMRIRKINIRSIKAEKLQYVNLANETRKAVYDEINANEEVYNLYEIQKIDIHLLQCEIQRSKMHIT